MTVTAEVCPNCGAPLNVVNGRCAFCETPLRYNNPGTGATGAVAPPKPVGDPSAPFSMPVEDVFSIKGRGTVLTGRIAAGTLSVGDTVILDHGGQSRPVTVTKIEMFRKELDQAVAGDNVGLMVKGEKGKDLKAEDAAHGDTLHAR